MDADLEKIAALPDNWDGHGGIRFLPETLTHADRVLAALRGAGLDVEVTPNPNGTIMLEWHNSAAIEVGRTRGVGYVKN